MKSPVTNSANNPSPVSPQRFVQSIAALHEAQKIASALPSIVVTIGARGGRLAGADQAEACA